MCRQAQPRLLCSALPRSAACLPLMRYYAGTFSDPGHEARGTLLTADRLRKARDAFRSAVALDITRLWSSETLARGIHWDTCAVGARRGFEPAEQEKILSSRPCLFLLSQAWVFEVDKSIKREKIKKGLYPGNPDDLPIQAPLEMFNIAGADFLDPVIYVHMYLVPK